MAGPRILISGGGTGGHLYPALQVAAALRRAEPEVRIFFLGARRGIEAEVLPGTSWPHRLLPLEPLYRRQPWRNWRLLATTPSVLSGLRSVFRSFDPQLVLGTGGYASGAAVLWGSLTGRHTAIQEQNAEPGLVTRMLSGRVDQIHLGYPEAEERLSPGRGTRVFAFGNPIAPGDGTAEFDWPPGRILLVVGGSQGALGLNERLMKDLERAAEVGTGTESGAVVASSGPSAREGPGESSSAARPTPFQLAWPNGSSIVWIAGRAHATSLAERARALPWADRIRVVPFVEDLGGQLSHVALAISRAGAMLVSELAAAGVPAIFVPLPTAAGGHQSANARATVEAGAALMREESRLAPGELWSLILDLMGDDGPRAEMAEAARARSAPGAADRIARELLSLVGT